MLQNGMCPGNYTLPYLLKACARMQRCRLGELVHGFCLKLGFVSDIFVGNSLIVMYCAFDDVKRALYVFDEMPSLSAVSRMVMISGFAKVGNLDMARLLFDEAPDTEPDEAIFVSVLCACAHLGALDIGIWIHSYLNRLRLRLSVRLTTGLIDMYAKCRRLELARGLLAEMLQRDTVCWNAMHGDDVTFIAVLTACSYSGMADEGMKVFDKMRRIYTLSQKANTTDVSLTF
ncbi:hypothetical protein ACFX2I_020838 [Malus domestica]